MTPLQTFAQAVTKAREAFDADRSMAAWLVFYEAKQRAHAELVAALPQVKEIEDFWRYVQSMASTAWLPIVEGEINGVNKSRCLCARCQQVKVSFPERFCDECRKSRRSDAAIKSRLTRELKEQMRKCPICHTTPLQPRQRKCDKCKQSTRRDRNRRYQKSLKESEIRRVRQNLTREAMLTGRQINQLGSPIEMLTAKAS